MSRDLGQEWGGLFPKTAWGHSWEPWSNRGKAGRAEAPGLPEGSGEESFQKWRRLRASQQVSEGCEGRGP